MKQTTSPGWMHETSAQGWCTGKTQRDGMEREAGGGIGMGNTCKSMADSCVWQKPLQYCKVISFQLIKVNEKKMGEGGGRGFWMGNTCKSMADSCQCMAKTATIL